MDNTSGVDVNALVKKNFYEYIDFGCSSGNSISHFGKLFDAKGKGLGLDIDPEKVKKATDSGCDAVVCDLTKLSLDTKVRFCVLNHFLEHVPDINDVGRIIINACQVSSEFVFIKQPYFDADSYLFTEGFKFYWSSWGGHPNHMTLLEFHNILWPLAEKGLINRYCIYGNNRVTDSRDITIHNLDSPIDQHGHDEDMHSEKRFINFDFPVYQEIMAIIDVSGGNMEMLEKKSMPTIKLFDSLSPENVDKFKVARPPLYIRIPRKFRKLIIDIIR